MAMTLAEKIVARAAGRERVAPGEIVTCAVDLAMIHDSGGPRRVAPILKRFGVGLWDPDKVVLISDHYVPAGDDETRRIGEVTRKFAAENKLAGFYAKRSLTQLPIEPDDQAEAIFVLVSQRLAKTTGHVIPVDGGLQDGFMR